MNASIYKKINKYYKTINLEMINDIINKFNHILDLYIEYTGMPERDYKNFIVKKILSNEKAPTAQTVNTVLNLVCAMFVFKLSFENTPERLFRDGCLYDYLLCATHNLELKAKDEYIFKDSNIPEVYNWFMNIEDNILIELLRKTRF